MDITCPVCGAAGCRACARYIEMFKGYTKETVASVMRHLRHGWRCFVCSGGTEICPGCWDVIYELRDVPAERLRRAALCALTGIAASPEECAVCRAADGPLCSGCTDLVGRLVALGKKRMLKTLAVLRQRCIACGQQAPPAEPFCEHCYALVIALRDPRARRVMRWYRNRR